MRGCSREEMLELGRRAGKEVTCLLTDMDQPLGRAVGNALEIREALDTVRGEGPADFTELVLDACARLLAYSDLGIDVDEGRRRAEAAVADGIGVRRPTSGGSARRVATPTRARCPRRPSGSPCRRRRTASSRALGALAVGVAALELGAGRRTKADTIDHAVGVALLRQARRRGARGRRSRRGARARRGVCGGRRRGGPRRLHDRRRGARDRAASCSTSSPERRSGDARTAVTPSSADRDAPPRLSSVPELPEVETVRRAIAPVLEGARLERRRDSRCAARAAVRPRRSSPASSSGSASATVGRRGKYLIVGFDSGRSLLDAPPDDGVAAVRESRGVGRRSSHSRCSQIRQWIGRRLPRRAALRHLGAVRARRPRAVPRGAARAGAARAALGGAARRAARGATGAAEGGAPRSADDRGAREHLRRRGAVDQPPASAPRRRQPRRRRSSADSTGRSVACCARGSSGRARRFATTRSPTEATARCRTSSGPTGVGESRATAAGTPLVRIVVGGRTTTFCPHCQTLPA